MTIRQSIEFSADAEQVYNALTLASEFSAVTGAPAEISSDEGGEFSCFGGQITGRHIELTPNERIVQAWRAGPWPDSVYSIVRLEIKKTGNSTTIDLEHAGFPDGGTEHLEAGWHKMYWDPLRAYLEK